MTAFTDLLADFESEKHLLVHLEPFESGGTDTVDLYYSTHGFTSEPGDTPANQYYEPRLKRAYQFQRSMFSSGQLNGSSVPSFGSITLINRDGGLDALAEYGWGGRRVRVWLGSTGFALSEYGLIFEGAAEGIEFGDGEIVVKLRDLKYLFDREIQTSVFAGTGAEEGGSDVLNRRKPLVYGVCRNVPMLYLGVNAGKHTFFAGAGIIGVLRVRDLGYELTFNASTPGPAEWTVDVSTGLVTLGGSYNGPITADIIGKRYLSETSSTSWAMATGSKAFTVTAGLAFAVGMKVRVGRTSALHSTYGDGLVTSYSGTTLTINITSLSATTGTHTDWTISPWGTVAGIIKSIATTMGATSFDSSSFSTLDTAQPATVGYYIPDGGNALQHMDAICEGASCNHGFTRAAAFQVGRLASPASPDSSYGGSAIIDDTLDRRDTDHPNHEVVVRYSRNWFGSMADNQLVGAVSAADRAYLTQEWRQAKANDTDVLEEHPLSKPITVDSIFDESADASAEASRLLAMFGVLRGYYTVRLKVQPLTLDIGGTTTITHARYDLTSGKALRRVDITEDLDKFEVELGLWG